MTPDYDLNKLLDKLDDGDRNALFVLLHLINNLVACHGNLPLDISIRTDKHYRIYLLHNTIMALLWKEIQP